MPTLNAKPSSRSGTAAQSAKPHADAVAAITYDALMEELFAQIDRNLDASEQLTAGLMNRHA